MATSVKKERSRRTSWLSPMWRDIDSLRKQNESTKREIEQTELETEQLRSETEILRRQNKALALIESRGLDALLKEASIPGHNDSKHPEDHLDLELLEEKLMALGCDAADIPFLFNVLELTKGKKLSPLQPIPEGLAQANKITTLDTTSSTGWRLGPYSLSDDGMLMLGDSLVSLSPLQRRLLQCFVRHNRTLLSKEQLIREGWGHEYVSEVSLARAVHSLRRMFAQGPLGSQLIRTVGGSGYILEASVREIDPPGAYPSTLEDAFMESEFKFSEFDEQDDSSQLPVSRQQQRRNLNEHAFRSNFDRMAILRCLGPDFYLERVIFPFEVISFQCPPECRVEIWFHGLGGPELIEEMGAEDLLIGEANASIEPIGSSWIETGSTSSGRQGQTASHGTLQLGLND
jgi:DNA-binding winged helix-turn-helix (wHTH) protein